MIPLSSRIRRSLRHEPCHEVPIHAPKDEQVLAGPTLNRKFLPASATTRPYGQSAIMGPWPNAKGQLAAFPRREYARVLPEKRAFRTRRAQGMPVRRPHPQPCVQRKKARKQVTAGTPKHRTFPARRFTAYNVLFPVTGFVATVACQSAPADLIPASGDQNHTPSPSASSVARQAKPRRPSHPAPTFVTTAKRPSVRARDAQYKS
jgi:hypothetical protein